MWLDVFPSNYITGFFQTQLMTVLYILSPGTFHSVLNSRHLHEKHLFSQPALFVAGLAAVEKLRSENPAAVEGCSATAGLSLGEYTALVFAGAMSFKDGLKVCEAAFNGQLYVSTSLIMLHSLPAISGC